MAGIKSAGFFVSEYIDVIRHKEGLKQKSPALLKRPGFDLFGSPARMKPGTGNILSLFNVFLSSEGTESAEENG